MPSTVRFLTTLTLIISVTVISLYVLAVFFEPTERELSHEVLGLSIEK